MQRRKFSREFKLEAVRLVKDRGVAVAQAARDLDVHENVLRKWVRELSTDPQHAFPGHGQLKPEQQEIDRLRKEVAKLKAERDILKKAAAYFAREAIPRASSPQPQAGPSPVPASQSNMASTCCPTSNGQRIESDLPDLGNPDSV